MSVRTLVLLPGMDGTGRLFAPLVAALAPDIDCIVGSYPDSAPDYTAHLRHAQTFLPRDRPYAVLGESFSGPIAIRLGADPPPLLRGLILGASFLRSPRTPLRLLRSALQFLPAFRPPSFISNYFLLGGFATLALKALHGDALTHASPRAMHARLELIGSVDVRPEARSLRLPCLYLRASDDRLVPATAAEQVLAGVPGAKLVEIRAPHLMLQVNPGDAARAIRGFLASLTPA
jgi:pimeloyl-ACP methyl ester carboxylesterase